MSIIQAIILGIVQGITEFLPVSSSGHLALFKILFHVETDTGMLFDVLLHVGTLIAVCDKEQDCGCDQTDARHDQKF